MKNLSNDEITEILHEAELKATPLRILIIEKIFSSTFPLTTGEIIKKVKRLKADDTSIYRALKSFCEKGILESHQIHKDKISYSIKEKSHKHHIVCQKCNTVESIDFCMKSLDKNAASKSKLFKKILGHNLSFLGTCRKCSRSVR